MPYAQEMIYGAPINHWVRDWSIRERWADTRCGRSIEWFALDFRSPSLGCGLVGNRCLVCFPERTTD